MATCRNRKAMSPMRKRHISLWSCAAGNSDPSDGVEHGAADEQGRKERDLGAAGVHRRTFRAWGIQATGYLYPPPTSCEVHMNTRHRAALSLCSLVAAHSWLLPAAGCSTSSGGRARRLTARPSSPSSAAGVTRSSASNGVQEGPRRAGRRRWHGCARTAWTSPTSRRRPSSTT